MAPRLRAIGLIARLLLAKGRLPTDVRQQLDGERLVLLAEGIPGILVRGAGSATGRRARPRKAGTIAAVAITQQRLLIFAAGEPLVDVTWDSGDARDLDVTADDRGLHVAFDAERFAADRSGRVELSLRIADATTLLAAIEQRRRPLEPRGWR